MSEAGDKLAEGIGRYQKALTTAEENSATIAARRDDGAGGPTPSVASQAPPLEPKVEA